MSLLMQALKKAERAQLHHAPEDDVAKPSEAFDGPLDEPLSLSPLDAHEEVRPSTAEPRPQRTAPPPPPPPRPRANPVAINRPDASTIRLLALLGVLLLIAAVFGYLYWRAVYGPGSSRNLPMVPMPGQNNPVPIAAAPPADPYATVETPAPVFNEPPAPVATTAPPVSTPTPPPPESRPASNAEEVSRIAQENLERAERMDRLTNLSTPRRAPPPAPYVPPTQSAPNPYPAASAPPPGYTGPSSTPPAATPVETGAIRVARASRPERVDPALEQGYTAYQRGDYAQAGEQYRNVLKQDPNNRDALLGSAALAVRERQGERAADIYARLLENDPNDADALAGLAALRQGDPQQTESRLRRALARAPESPALLFALGNVYARQGRWPEAQQQFFKAYTNAPENADYAYNLAVGLDRLGQPKLALNYYQKALALNPGAVTSFNRLAAQARVHELGGN